MKNGIITFLAVFFITSAVTAAPPRRPEFLKDKPDSFHPCRTMEEAQLRDRRLRGLIPGPAADGTTSSSSTRVLVLRVTFLDGPAMSTSLEQAESLFAGMRDYFFENSYGALTVDVTVSPAVYRLGRISQYDTDSGDVQSVRLWNDATGAATADHDFGSFDNVVIMHAGYGEEDTGDPSDLWSQFYTGDLTAEGKVFPGFLIVPERATYGSPLGVICHEYGHQLGLPDLYNTITGNSTCGAWSLMDYPYVGLPEGSNPPHLDPWSKGVLGFIDLDARVAGTTLLSVKLLPVETSSSEGFYKIPVETGTGREYFIVEYRNRTASGAAYDKGIPGSGVLVWHIDDTVARDPVRLSRNDINIGFPANMGVDLVEADGIATRPPGKASDAFGPGAVFTSPLSDAFNGAPSGVTLAGIALTDSESVFALARVAAATSVTISKALNYPNPAGSGYYHPRSPGGVLTTFVCHLTKPDPQLTLTVFSLSGETVRSVRLDSGDLNGDLLEDYRWVYEYDWDGKNDSGENVAPGLYFYRLSTGDDKVVGRMVVVR